MIEYQNIAIKSITLSIGALSQSTHLDIQVEIGSNSYQTEPIV